MDEFLLNQLRQKGFENGINIFRVDNNYKSYKIYYCDNGSLAYKTISVSAMDLMDDVIAKIKAGSIEKSKKPPLGLTPHFIWIEQRIEDIINAIDRYRKI